MTLPTTHTERPRRARMPLSIWIVAVVLPLLVGLVAVAVQLAWLPELPEQIVVHWGPDGPDGYGPVWSTTVLTASVILGLVVMFAAILSIPRGAAPTAIHKFLAVTSLAVSLLLGVGVTATLGIQRGLDDLSQVPDITPWMLVAFLAALVAGVVAWFLLPKAVTPVTDPQEAAPLRLSPGERSVWIADTRLSGSAFVVIMLTVGLALVATVFAVVVSDGQGWPVLFVPLLLLVVCGAGIAWRVRVDPAGITVRSRPFGWPRTSIPASEIAAVQTSQVDPLAEFGGWGWRWAPGRNFGVISRGGEAIEVTRRDGRRFTVTVDDAETGAALLAAYAGGSPAA